MDEIYIALEKKLNYDVVCIIKDFVDLLYKKHMFDYVVDQINSINKEHVYLVWDYNRDVANGRYYVKPPPCIDKFILESNNYKINLNKETDN